MIPINPRFSIAPDRIGWMLIEHIPIDSSHHKAKGEGTKKYTTYHPHPAECAQAILERTGYDCETAHELVRAWERIVEQVREATEGVEA